MSKTTLYKTMLELQIIPALTISNFNGRGVYALLLNDDVVYIGKTNNIYSRLGIHLSKKEKAFDSVVFYQCESLCKQKEIEARLIHAINPRYNEEYPSLPGVSGKRRRRLVFDVS